MEKYIAIFIIILNNTIKHLKIGYVVFDYMGKSIDIFMATRSCLSVIRLFSCFTLTYLLLDCQCVVSLNFLIGD